MGDGKVLDRAALLDALDVETFLICRDAAEGKRMMLALMAGMGLEDIDIVFVEHRGPGARVRGRAYAHRPGVGHAFAGDRP
ncbi:MAG: hypothetical protein ACOY94_14370 [Bacillota bacterium]